jgi:protein required for attachment to host cells
MVQNTKETWVLVAQRGGARIFEIAGPGNALHLVQEIEHPQGKLKDRDLGSDEPGRGFDSHGGRHAFEAEQGPAARITEQFAKHLATLLDDARARKRYTRLVLVAEPHFLGILRAALTRDTGAAVIASLNKDLGHLDVHHIPAHLDAVLPG